MHVCVYNDDNCRWWDNITSMELSQILFVSARNCYKLGGTLLIVGAEWRSTLSLLQSMIGD